MFNSPNPNDFIAEISTALERYGNILLTDALKTGLRYGLSAQYVEDLLSYLVKQGVIEGQGEKYVLSKETADQLAAHTARLIQKPNIPPMRFTAPELRKAADIDQLRKAYPNTLLVKHYCADNPLR